MKYNIEQNKGRVLYQNVIYLVMESSLLVQFKDGRPCSAMFVELKGL
jgi:hypothetical protein